jgi:hypothetical protein
MHMVVIGGGAAGYFGAIHAAEANPQARVLILERAANVLGKVKISGGGRCNVCHHEYDPRVLAKSYPRGGKALLGPFHRFCTGDTIAWFDRRGVPLKAEDDGRMFPITDDSQTIIDCLTDAARQAGVQLRTQANVTDIQALPGGRWQIILADTGPAAEPLIADRVLIAPGSSTRMWEILSRLGHRVAAPVPSLFTFNIRDERLRELPGIAVDAAVSVPGTKLREQGPVLITHWGLSGPAILRLSAWGARELHARDHRFELRVHWLPLHKTEALYEELCALRRQDHKRYINAHSLHGLPIRLWKKLVTASGINDNLRWADASNTHLRALATELTDATYTVTGKSANKEEFVTCGGVHLDEVNFKTMESKLLPGIFFAGEILDVDAITGGYNFQAAWTTGAIAGMSIAAEGA